MAMYSIVLIVCMSVCMYVCTLLQIAGVRMVLDYGNHSFADFRNWTNGKSSRVTR